MNAGDGIARVAFSKITNVSSTCYVRYAYTAADAPTEYKDTNGNVPIKVTCTIDGVSDTKNLLFIAPNTNPNLSPDLITNQNYYFEVDSDGNLDTNFKMQTTPELAGLSSYIHAKDTADFSDLYPKDPKLLEYMRNEFDVRDIALLYINHAMSVA
ncbi:hypothetical protein FACS1894166_05870 [Bacilli bacterium]|nr:hypothetical protein FACS1894166_05870 [Bacilli bacterium]